MTQEPTPEYHPFSLSVANQWLLGVLSFFLVAFGQPAWLMWSGLIASAIGFALFWRVLLAHPSAKKRFYLGTLWFCAVQLVQLSWFISHPFWYIYSVYLFLAVAMGIQFGLLSLLIRSEAFTQISLIKTLIRFLPIAALWTIFEWTRLFAFSGFSFNPIGIALSGNLYALQAASLAGVLGLSFWVILVNLFALWAWVKKNPLPIAVWLIALVLPYAYGILQVAYHDHDKTAKNESKNLNALLVQTAFSPEESQEYTNKESLINHVINEWGKILTVTEKHRGKAIDLIVLPEFVVPFGTYSDVYPLIEVKKTFYEVFGPESLKFLPNLEHPFFSLQGTVQGPQLMVNNAFWTQGLANFFDADVLIGLEDAEDMPHGTREYYSAAIFIHPQKQVSEEGTSGEYMNERYSKRVLVPMGEYIPFEACRNLAARYGVFGSFTCGREAVIMNSHGIDFSPSICYEETFGDIMSEGRQKGADLFVNLTSDVWYPDSKLPRQHLDHARLRTVENGVPLIRACNTGITAAIDSSGRDIAVLGGENPEAVEWVSDSLLVSVPVYTYQTLYSRFGDMLIIGISLAILLGSLVRWLIVR